MSTVLWTALLFKGPGWGEGETETASLKRPLHGHRPWLRQERMSVLATGSAGRGLAGDDWKT